MTRVVNLRSAIKPYVYIGRAGRGEDGYFGNPHRAHGIACALCQGVTHSRTSAVAAFRGYFYERIRTDTEYKRRVEELRDKDLACPGNCQPRACHGDVYVEYLDGNGSMSDPSGTVAE